MVRFTTDESDEVDGTEEVDDNDEPEVEGTEFKLDEVEDVSVEDAVLAEERVEVVENDGEAV